MEANPQGPPFYSSRPLSNDASEELPRPLARRYPAITHFAVFSAFVLPMVVLPYLLARRRISALNRRLEQMNAEIKLLHNDMNRALSELAGSKDEHRKIRVIIHELLQETDELRVQGEKANLKRNAIDQAARSDLQRLLEKTQYTTWSHASILRALGPSLADVATFMYRIELEMGLTQKDLNNKQGVEHLRTLALKMQQLDDHGKVSGGSESGIDCEKN
ncbi:hypothetical protein BDQ12DRAFT_674585 [Crucibulum laeve]|uniref:Uncharacterized protein n=1 Tax=Crucibulum laeve TaxID=68775 RepID=A0A5C3MCM9_9AGAR|nr:hypothetical protein BDQ12DRAFT_674585 [Crucibulum laeve]